MNISKNNDPIEIACIHSSLWELLKFLFFCRDIGKEVENWEEADSYNPYSIFPFIHLYYNFCTYLITNVFYKLFQHVLCQIIQILHSYMICPSLKQSCQLFFMYQQIYFHLSHRILLHVLLMTYILLIHISIYKDGLFYAQTIPILYFFQQSIQLSYFQLY